MALGDWPIDYNVQARNKGVSGGNKGSSTSASAPGLPPEGHSRRCQAKARSNLWAQCKHWALQGQIYCYPHFRKFRSTKHGGTMSYIYHYRAKKKLKDYLDEISALDNPGDITGEIDVCRAVADRACEVFQKVCLAEDEGKEISNASKLKTMMFVQEAMTKAAGLVEKQAKINAMRAITPEQVAFVNQQMILILKKILMPTHEDLFVEIVKEFDELKIPERNVTINVS